MWLRSSRVRRGWRSIIRILKTHYPGFVFGLPQRSEEIPVFVYHDVEPDEFSADLTFLRENGYRTLTTEEFLKTNGNVKGQRSVLLTFDDARSNFWETAFPLLEQFNVQVTLFVPSHWVGRRESVSHNCPCKKTVSFMTWQQLKACKHSGLVDIQSHGHRHALVYHSDRLVDFVTPEALRRYDIFDWPMRNNGQKDIQGFPPLGTPIYEATPLLSSSYRLFESENVTAACQKFVKEKGNKNFFKSPDCYRSLLRYHQGQAGMSGHFQRMNKEAFQRQVRSDFTQAKKLFENETGTPPRYFAAGESLLFASRICRRRVRCIRLCEIAVNRGENHGIRSVVREVGPRRRTRGNGVVA